MMKNLRATESKDEAVTLLNAVKAYLDRLSSKRILHKNTVANYKSELERGVSAL